MNWVLHYWVQLREPDYTVHIPLTWKCMQYTMIVIYHAVVKSHGHKIHESQQRTLCIRIIAVIIIIKTLIYMY